MQKEKFDKTNVDDIPEAAPLWLVTRTAIFQLLVEVSGLYKYLIDFAKHSDVKEEDRIELEHHGGYGEDGIIERPPGLSKKEVGSFRKHHSGSCPKKIFLVP